MTLDDLHAIRVLRALFPPGIQAASVADAMDRVPTADRGSFEDLTRRGFMRAAYLPGLGAYGWAPTDAGRLVLWMTEKVDRLTLLVVERDDQIRDLGNQLRKARNAD